MNLPTELSSTIKEDFDRDGFVVLRGFLSLDEVGELQRELDRYFREVGPGLPPGEMMYEDMQRPETLKMVTRFDEHDAYFRDLVTEDRFVELSERLLAGPVVLEEVEWFNKMPRYSLPTPPHQDNYYYMLDPAEALTIWIALDDVDEENGCLRYVRGSHRLGLRAHARSEVLGFSQGIPDYDSEGEGDEIAIPAQPGDALVHHSLTVHRADANCSVDRQQRSFGVSYFSSRAKKDVVRLKAYQRKLLEELKQGNRI